MFSNIFGMCDNPDHELCKLNTYKDRFIHQNHPSISKWKVPFPSNLYFPIPDNMTLTSVSTKQKSNDFHNSGYRRKHTCFRDVRYVYINQRVDSNRYYIFTPITPKSIRIINYYKYSYQNILSIRDLIKFDLYASYQVYINILGEEISSKLNRNVTQIIFDYLS